MENNIQEGIGVVFKDTVGKFALLVLKHLIKQQVSKLNDFAFRAIQLSFCQLEDTAEIQRQRRRGPFFPQEAHGLGWLYSDSRYLRAYGN